MVGEVLRNAPDDLTQAEMLVLVSLAESARDATRIAAYDSSVAELAERTRLAAATVKSVLHQLKRYGLIAPLNGTAHRGKVQHYHVIKLEDHHRDVVTKTRRAARSTTSDRHLRVVGEDV